MYTIYTRENAQTGRIFEEFKEKATNINQFLENKTTKDAPKEVEQSTEVLVSPADILQVHSQETGSIYLEEEDLLDVIPKKRIKTQSDVVSEKEGTPDVAEIKGGLNTIEIKENMESNELLADIDTLNNSNSDNSVNMDSMQGKGFK